MPKIFVCGDIVNIENNQQFIDDGLIDILKNSDYSVCNFEGPVNTNNAKPIPGVGKGICQHESTISSLKEAGFNLLLMANNHICDFGKEGLKNTLEIARQYSFDTIGAGLSFELTYTTLIKEIGGVIFGFINVCEAQFGQFSYNSQEYGYAWINHPIIDKIVCNLKSQVDYVILFAHAGLEHHDIPLIQWRERYRKLCDLGVDCLVGAHPHINQGIEVYKNKYIFYSLGNFYFQTTSLTEKIKDQSFSIIIDFNKNKAIDYQIVYHLQENGKIFRILEKDSKINLRLLNNKLMPLIYNDLISKTYKETYENLCYALISQSLMATNENDNILETLKKIIKYVFFRKKFYRETKKNRDLLLLRLIRNETYRFIIQSALELNCELNTCKL